MPGTVENDRVDPGLDSVTVFHDLVRIGLRPTLAGCSVVIMSAVAGWGVAGHPQFLPVRTVSFWVRRVILGVLKSESWTVRSAAIFFNNASICALVVAAGMVPGGSWILLTIVGFSMGVAMRVLGEESGWTPEGIANASGNGIAPGEGAGLFGEDRNGDRAAPQGILHTKSQGRVDSLARLGFVLNLVEVPAIVVAVGLSMGQLAAPNELSAPELWRIFGLLVLPVLVVAAGGESLWIGRVRPFS